VPAVGRLKNLNLFKIWLYGLYLSLISTHLPSELASLLSYCLIGICVCCGLDALIDRLLTMEKRGMPP